MRPQNYFYGMILVLWLAVFAAFPPAVNAQSVCGANPNFDFGSGVTPEQRNLIQEATANAVSFICKATGISAGDFTVFASTDLNYLIEILAQRNGLSIEWAARQFGAALSSPKAIFLYTADSSWNWNSAGTSTRVYVFRVLGHEYFHLLQRDLARQTTVVENIDAEGIPIKGPNWLVEGSAELAGFLSVDYAGLRSFGSIKEELLRGLTIQVLPLYAPAVNQDYAISFAGSEFLGGSNLDRFVSFWASIGSGAAWRNAFETSFGRKVEVFYPQFEQYRYKLNQETMPLSVTFERAYSPGMDERIWNPGGFIPYVFRITGISLKNYSQGPGSIISLPAGFGHGGINLGWDVLIVQVPQSTPTGTYTVGLELPDGRNAYTNFKHIASTVNPSISKLIPGTAKEGTPGFVLDIEGQNFSGGAAAQVNGVVRLARVNSPTAAEVPLTAADISKSGKIMVNIVNPGNKVSNQDVLTVSPVVNLNPLFTISNLTDLSRGTAFKVGDSWELRLENGPPSGAVYLRIWLNEQDLGISGPYGAVVDGQGRWSLSGSLGSDSVGSWRMEPLFGDSKQSFGSSVAFTVSP